MPTFYRVLFTISIIITSTQLWAGEVSRAQFTSHIENREPVDLVTAIHADRAQIKYFTELSGLSGHTITHQWMHNNKVKSEKSFLVNSELWRVWSRKTIPPGLTGKWTVNILDENSDRMQLATDDIKYE